MRQYKNFAEIDRDLKLLKFQKEIDRERVILYYNETKHSMSPGAILKSAVGTLFKSAIVIKTASKVLSFLRKRFT